MIWCVLLLAAFLFIIFGCFLFAVAVTKSMWISKQINLEHFAREKKMRPKQQPSNTSNKNNFATAFLPSLNYKWMRNLTCEHIKTSRNTTWPEVKSKNVSKLCRFGKSFSCRSVAVLMSFAFYYLNITCTFGKNVFSFPFAFFPCVASWASVHAWKLTVYFAYYLFGSCMWRRPLQNIESIERTHKSKQVAFFHPFHFIPNGLVPHAHYLRILLKSETPLTTRDTYIHYFATDLDIKAWHAS